MVNSYHVVEFFLQFKATGKFFVRNPLLIAINLRNSIVVTTVQGIQIQYNFAIS